MKTLGKLEKNIDIDIYMNFILNQIKYPQKIFNNCRYKFLIFLHPIILKFKPIPTLMNSEPGRKADFLQKSLKTDIEVASTLILYYEKLIYT